MGILRIDHPDIEEFVRAKQNLSKLTGFNTSIAITDEFMRCVTEGTPFTLRWGGVEYSKIDARALWEEIMRSTWDWAEPGVLFIDRINEMNNLHYCETIAATNPCGEEPLPPNGTCLLGSFNLVKYVDVVEKRFDFGRFIADIPIVVRAMDNIIDRTIYPLPDQEREAKHKRRMGLGVTGLANAIEALGHPYGSSGFLEWTRNIMSTLRNRCYTESALLALEKGPFPAFEKEGYLQSEFIKSLPLAVTELIEKYGIRNSHLLSIAPTGTISICADNVSSGIEPPFALSYKRLIREFDTDLEITVEDYAFRKWGVMGKTAEQCTIDEHLNVLSTVQQYVDSAVSKTINVDPNTSWDAFKDVYFRAWKSRCKGVTTFNPKGKRMGILTHIRKEEGEACYIDPETGVKTCDQ